MGRLDMNIKHGDLGVRIRHGGGGGPDPGGALQAGALIGVAIGVAMVIAAFAWLIITAGVIAAAARLYLLYRKNAALAAIAEAFAREHEIRAERADTRLAEQRAHELEVARISAGAGHAAIDLPAIAAIVAAAVAGAQPQPQPVRILRGEVER